MRTLNKKRLVTAVLLLTSILTIGAKSINYISLPPSTREGFLPNGLHYIIKNNNLPRHNVECRLVMNVGSIDENENQKGVAHFLEHMTFNGSKHFPGRNLIDFFERQGMKYGRDINAFTGFDRTIFWFTMPIDKHTTNIVDSTLLAIGDILSNLTINSERTKKERGIILEELRGYSTHDDFYDLKIGKGKYAQHMPLGRAQDIANASRSTLVDFYNHWYAPERATVIIIGNIDPKATETKIKNLLSSVPKKNIKKATVYPLIYDPGITTMSITDSLESQIKMDFIIPHHTILSSDIKHVVKKIRMDILVNMLERRISEHHIHTMVSDAWYLADKNHLSFTFENASADTLLSQVTTIADELKFLAKKGPEENELSWAIGNKLLKIKADPTDKMSSGWCDDFIDYTVLGDRHIYDQNEIQTIKKEVKKTSAKDIKLLAKYVLDASKETILAGIRDVPSTHTPINKTTILEAWNKGNANNALPFVKPKEIEGEKETTVNVPAILKAAHPYNANIITSKKHYDELGLDEVKLANGATILLRPTFAKGHSVSITAIARGGVGDVPDSLYNHLKDAIGYVDMGGIATINQDTLTDVMANKKLMMNIGMENYWHQAMVTAFTEDAQEVMNLLYEKMNHPGKDNDGFKTSKQEELDTYGHEDILSQMMKRDQSRVINNKIDSLLGNNTVAAQYIPYTKKDIENLNLDDMTAFYKRAYTDPSQLRLIITGNFNTDSICKIAVSTFARMKKPANPLNLDTTAFRLPDKSIVMKFPNEDPTQTICNCIFTNNYKPCLKNSLLFKLMRDVIENRLLSILREKDNIVYSPFADVQYHGVPQKISFFRLYIDVKNENFNKMKNELKGIINELRSTPVKSDELNKIKRSFIVTKRQALTDVAPTEWKNALMELTKNGETIEDYNNYDDILYAITPQDVMEGFRKYIDFNKLILLYQKK
jgi:zinc protease